MHIFKIARLELGATQILELSSCDPETNLGFLVVSAEDDEMARVNEGH